MADIQYLNYGDQQIEQQALLNNLANQVQGYVQSQPWSNKRKEKFMSAYSDLMNRGILGASNNTGQWMIDVNGDPLPEMSRKDKEMYQEAAYFIQQQMAALPTKTAEEEKKVEDLPVFDFNKDFITHVNNSINGGQPLNIGYGDSDQWNYLDERDSNGIRGRKNRAKKLAELLESYKTKLGDGSKYKFEGSPYSDINDFNTKIDRAIAALRTDSIDDDREALQAIGLNQATWFNNGSGDPSGKVDANGNPLTYGQLTEQQEQKVLEEQGQQEKLNQQNRIKNSGVLTISANNNPLDAVYNAQKYQEHLGTTYGVGQTGFNSINDKIQELLERSYNGGKGNGLNSAERKQLGNLIHYIRTNNPNYQNYNLSRQDEAELSKHESLKGKRLQDFIRLPWQTSDGRYTYADKSGNIYFLKPQNQAKLAAPTFQRSAAYNNYRNNFLKSQLQLNNEKPVLSQDTDILISDMTSMLGDIVSLGGGSAGAAGGATTLLSDLYGDIRRGKDTWSTIKNLGANIAWGAAGLIPGAKLGKLAKNAARIYATLQSAGILMNDDVQQSWKNLIAGKPISAKDFENFKWTLHAITGGTNAVRGHLTERNIAEQVKTNNKPSIETKSGVKPITQEQVNKINKVGRKKGQEAAEKEFERLVGAKPKEGTFKFTENGTNKINPTRYSQRLRNLLSDDERLILPKTTQSVNTQNVNKLLEIDKAKPIIGIGNPFNRRFWTEGGPNRGGLTFALAPYRNNSSNNSGNTTNIDESSVRVSEGLNSQQYRQSQVGRTNPAIKNSSELPENVKFNREAINNYKNMIKGNFSNNELQSGSYNLAGAPLQVVKQSDGTFNVLFKGNVIANERNQREIQKTIRDLIKNTVQQGKSNSSSKISAKEMGKLLKEFKAKGWLKHGGTIDKQRIQRYKEFINK